MKFSDDEYNLITIALMSYSASQEKEACDLFSLAEQGFTGDNSEENFVDMANNATNNSELSKQLANKMMGLTGDQK